MSLDNAKNVLDKLRSYGLKASIAGGYARDVFFRLEPKDVDIIVFGIADREKAIEAATTVVPEGQREGERRRLGNQNMPNDTIICQATQALLYDYGPSNSEFYVEGTYNIYHSKEASDDQLLEVHKFNCGIDVLVYPECEILFEALQFFDFNLNQFALVGEELVPEYMGMDSLLTLVKTRLDPDAARIAYVKEKHKAMLPLIEEAIAEGRIF